MDGIYCGNSTHCNKCASWWKSGTDSIANKLCLGAVTVTDSYTTELAKAVDSVFRANFDVMLHLVICNLSRKKVDMNGEVEIGTCANKKLKSRGITFTG